MIEGIAPWPPSSYRRAGRAVWTQVVERLDARRALQVDPGPATVAAVKGPRFGAPTLVMPRLGQGAFRVMVMDAYGRLVR